MQRSLESLRRQFRGFPKAYSMAPYWYWNDDLREEEIVRQLDEMKRQHVLEPALMPGAGLLVPYLSPAYFEAYRFALKEVRRRGMRLWIYDDYNWPSGMAGGRVIEDYPEYRHTGCRLYRYPVARKDPRAVTRELPAGRLIWAQAERRSDGKRLELLDRCDEFALRWTAGPGEWDLVLCVIHPVQRTQESVTGSRWASNLPGYVDVMNREAMAKYIELVHEGHYRAAPEYFGTTVRGFLTDEASVWFDMVIKGGRQSLSASHHTPFGRRVHAPGNPILDGFVRSVPWSRGFQHIFRERVGYDIRPHLPTLLRPDPAHRAFFHDYFKLVSDLYAESYAEQIGAWCGRHKVAFSGHWDEGPGNGDYYRKVAPMQVPGIDLLGGLVATHSLMALPRMAATIAKMKGRPRVLAETYGVTPWTYELSNKIQSADFLTVLGINLHAPIDYASSFRSFRKHTSNPPGFYHASNWPYQRCLSDHIARLCCATAAGRSTAAVALLYGSSQAVSDTLTDPAANGLLEKHLRTVFTAYLDAQIEADVIPETGLPEGRWSGGRLAYPGAVYRTLALPHLHILDADTVRRLAGFVRGGGTLLVHGPLPRLDPRGRDVSPLWRQGFGASVFAEADTVRRLDIGRGRVWLIPPERIERQVMVSTAQYTDQRFNLFDGTDSLFVISPPFPLWLALDLGTPRMLTGFALGIEPIKQGITYAYDVQISSDGRAWKTLASYRRRGLIHPASLPRVKARYVRWVVRGADDARRKFGLSDLTLRVLDAQGVERRWLPERPRPTDLAALLPAERPPVVFQQDGSLAGNLVSATRACGGALIQAVVNRSDARRRLEAQVRPGYALEAWDLDTGKAAGVPLPAGRRVPVDFEPYEARVLVLQKRAAARRPLAGLTRDRSVLAESAGPWPFRAERANVLPLTLGNLRMADPMRPGQWLASDGGRIPEALRFVSVLHFACDLEFEAVTGGEDLLFEEGIFAALKVNGRPLEDTAYRRNRYLDAFGLSAPISRFLARGRNTITGLYFPEMFERLTQGPMFHWPALQPTLDAFVLGAFAVAGGRAVQPVARLTAKPWQEQGYPYYSGTGVYTVRFDRLVRGRTVWLEADVRGGVMDVRAGKEPVGVRVAPPYVVDVSRFVRRGRREFEIRVTNTTGTLMRAQGVGYYHGSASAYASGLAWARLVQPCE